MSRWLALILLACQATPTPEDVPSEEPTSFRAVMLADTHIIGPQYTCCSESPGIDNDSIMKTEDRMNAVRDHIHAMDPRPDLVFILGDATHNPYYSTERAWYDTERTAFHILSEIVDTFEMPVHIAWGNHDYDVSCDGAYVSREFSHELFDSFLDTPPYHSVEHKGWRFLLMNSQLGPTWEVGHPLCDTSFGSYGREQLAWIDEELSQGDPSFVMAHHMLLVTEDAEDPDGPFAGLETVLNQHDNLKRFFAGHTHRWLDFAELYNFDHTVVAATRYDDDNFWTLEFQEDGTYTIVDEEKAKWALPCADTWWYQGTPSLDGDGGPEEGDCQ